MMALIEASTVGVGERLERLGDRLASDGRWDDAGRLYVKAAIYCLHATNYQDNRLLRKGLDAYLKAFSEALDAGDSAASLLLFGKAYSISKRLGIMDDKLLGLAGAENVAFARIGRPGFDGLIRCAVR
jgi:hypothetical protein